MERRTRFRRLFAFGAGALLVLVALVSFALVQRGNADERARDAQARELDASAVALLEEDPELSLLLASESARTSPAPTAERALRQALLASRVRATFDAGGAVTDLAVAPDGSLVAFTSAGGQLSVRRLDDGTEVLRAPVAGDAAVSFSPGSDAVLVADDDSPPRLVDIESGDTRCVLGEEDVPAADAVIVGQHAVTVRSGRGYVWDTGSCDPLHTLESVGKTAVSLWASPDGRAVAFLSGKEALVVDVPSGRERFVLRHTDELTALAFSDDGRRIVTGGRDRIARVWDGEDGSQLHGLTGNQGEVLDVAIDAKGSQVASASTDGTARVWGTGVAGSPRGYLHGHENFVGAVDLSGDGESVVTGSLDRSARTWRPTGQMLALLAGHEDTVTDAVLTPDGFTVVTASDDGTVRVWDAGTRPDLVATEAPAPEPAATTATSPDGSTTASVSGTLVVLEHADGSTSDLAGHRLRVTSVSFSPDGTRLLSASRDHDVILWDVATGRQLRVLRGHFGTVSDARFSADGRWIASAGPRSVGLWQADDGQLLRLLYGAGGPFEAVEFRDGSRTIVVSDAGGAVSSYDCRVCAEIPGLLEYAGELLALTGRELTPEERELYVD
jgi:WD40 repeat protein